MQIRLEITETEIRELQEKYAETSPKPRLSFEEWAGREIASHFSKAWSQKGEWAVQDTFLMKASHILKPCLQRNFVYGCEDSDFSFEDRALSSSGFFWCSLIARSSRTRTNSDTLS